MDEQHFTIDTETKPTLASSTSTSSKFGNSNRHSAQAHLGERRLDHLPELRPGEGLPVGTGPFKLVEAGPQGVFFDRDDNWWGAKTGFSQPSKITRQSFLPLGTGAATFARMINNELDVDWTVQPGEFVAGNSQNPDVRSWNATGPSWGAPDACLYTLGLNTQIRFNGRRTCAPRRSGIHQSPGNG